MLDNLQKRWNVNGRHLLLILCVFAVTGFTTAFVSKAVTGWVGFTQNTHWGWKALLRTGVLLVGYPIILLLAAALFGRFSFFWQFQKRLWQRLLFLKDKEFQYKKSKERFDGKTEDRRKTERQD